jgi:hypothetical protein
MQHYLDGFWSYEGKIISLWYFGRAMAGFVGLDNFFCSPVFQFNFCFDSLEFIGVS